LETTDVTRPTCDNVPGNVPNIVAERHRMAASVVQTEPANQKPAQVIRGKWTVGGNPEHGPFKVSAPP
jgi:hypothetical protein